MVSERPRGTTSAPGDKVYLPIIPLWGTAAEEVPLTDWPRYDPVQLETLRGQFARRVDAVIRRLIDRHVHEPLSSPGPARGQAFPGEAIGREPDRRAMAEDLTERGLIR